MIEGDKMGCALDDGYGHGHGLWLWLVFVDFGGYDMRCWTIG